MGVIIWSIVALILAGLGIWAFVAKKPVGFYSGVKPPEVTDVKGYNRAVGILWIVYAVMFELLGISILFLDEKPLLFLVPILGTVVISIALPIAYNQLILKKYKK